MIDKTARTRFKRRMRKRQRQVEGMSLQAEEQLEKLFFKRLGRLFEVRRFVIAWIMFLVVLGIGVTLQIRALTPYYQELGPIPGGTYTEGMVGSFSNANPLFATSTVDTTVSHLIFAGLLKFDSNNRLVGDLAEKWKVEADGKIYTVTLRPNLEWQDGKKITAEDVVFTFQTVQNPDVKSPLFHAWQGVQIKAVDERTIVFTLPNALAPFIYNLTTGIVPKHSLQGIDPAGLRSTAFNTSKPVGAGPFTWETIEIIANGSDPNLQHIGLKASQKYYAGPPKLDQYVIKTYANEGQLVNALKKREVSGVVGFDRIPDDLKGDNQIVEHTASLTAETMLFFKTNSELLKDVKVRQALVSAVDVPKLLAGLDYPVIPADEPLLHGQLGYSPALRQRGFNIEQANKLLEEAGWKRKDPKGVRYKGETKLALRLFGQNNADHAYITQAVQKAWAAVGVETEVNLPTDTELQTTVVRRDYDVLLYGISIGTDPDVFAYWHSSQLNPATAGLNFSNYVSSASDKALEAGRTRSDQGLRSAKYQPFLQAWQNDAPALALYQPRFLYITRGPLFGFEPKIVNGSTDRLNNVENWMVQQGYQLKQK